MNPIPTQTLQTTLHTPIRPAIPCKPGKYELQQLLPLSAYDYIILLLSGGKDSVAALLCLLELGVPTDKILLFHHDIDGGHPDLNMDWPCTSSYVQAISDAFNIQLIPSWREHGFWGEVHRLGASRPVYYQQGGVVMPCPKTPAQIRHDELLSMPLTQEVLQQLAGLGQCMQLPAKGAIAKGRWCSSVLKALVGDSLIRSLPLFNEPDIRLLVVSGERREESASRSHYNEIELHRTNATVRLSRHVHTWRIVIDHIEQHIWRRLEHHSIMPHPCYYAGWNRCSCAMCIFGQPHHWAGIRDLMPGWYAQMKSQEIFLGHTLNHKTKDKVTTKIPLDEYTAGAKSCLCKGERGMIAHLLQNDITQNDIFMPSWRLPTGAYKGAEGGPC